LLTVANDRVARVWALEAGKRPRLIRSLAGHVGPTNYGAWSPDGLAIVVREQTGLRVWLAQGNATIDDARPEPSPATHARFHPAGDRVLLTFESGPAHEIGFTPGAGLGVDRALGDRAALDVAATADGELVLVAEAGGPVRVWRRVDGGALVESRTLTLDALSLHPAETGTLLGLRLAAGGVAVVDLASDAVHRFAEGETVNALDLSADAARLVLGTESGSLRVYLVADGRLLWNEQIAPVSLINTGILAVAFAGPTRVLSAGPFKDVVVRDAATGRVERTVTETTIGAMIALRDGERLLTRSQWGAQASVASLQADGLPRMLRSPANRETHRNRLTDWAIDAAQRRLLTTSLDRVANVWDVARGEAWATYSGHADPVLAGDLSRDGEWAVTADSSGAVHVWPTDPLRWARAAVLAEPAPGAR